MQDDTKPATRTQRLLTTLVIVVMVGTLLSWAAATVFGLAFMKAVAVVVLAIFAVIVGLLMLGLS